MLMPALVECVPNFSEGRDQAKVDAIIEAMKLAGVYLLDREMDADHNRCVITLAGDPGNVEEAAIRGVGKAAELIDLTKHHRGAHPRLGAADVMPFIPITASRWMTAWRWRAAWALRSGSASAFPCISTKPRPRGLSANLENIRRGQFEGIRDEIATNPARMPDFGEAACTRPPARPWWARASFSSPTTSISTHRTWRSPRRSAKRFASLPAACAT